VREHILRRGLSLSQSWVLKNQNPTNKAEDDFVATVGPIEAATNEAVWRDI